VTCLLSQNLLMTYQISADQPKAQCLQGFQGFLNLLNTTFLILNTTFLILKIS